MLKLNLLFGIILFCVILEISSETSKQQINDDSSSDLKENTCIRDTCTDRDTEKSHKNEDIVTRFDKDQKEKVEDLTKIGESDEADMEDTDYKFRNFDYPPLSRVDPGNIGDIVDVELEEGKFYKRITRAVRPPIFEIPDYLSKKECNMIIKAALDTGLERSGVVGADINDERSEAAELAEISRVSEQTWLGQDTISSDLWERLVKRLSKLIQLPVEQIEVSEQIQVVSYVRGGHYHAHLDSTDTTDKIHLPCCFQSPECLEIDINTEGFEECCRICRYITVLYYLNDVEEGGETAFPLADMPDELFKIKMTDRVNQQWYDLSHYCYNSSVKVTPKRGTAVMWYNHFVDENGYLGHVDERSHHGGCDIIKGTKWIANNWISATNYRDRHKPTIVD